jgi:hypothetical protein
MQPQLPSVPEWVRSIMCLTAAGAVPGMLIAAYFGVTLSVGVAATIVGFAVCSAQLAFRAGKEDSPSPSNADQA